MTSFILKLIGIICMLCDHIGDAFIGHFSFLNLIGRIAFPIFAFQLVQGYIHTHNTKKYILRLFIFACISQIPFMLFLSTFRNNYYLNIFFTLTLGIISLYLFDKVKNHYIGTLLVSLICVIAYLIHVDYGYFGVLVIFMFYILKDKKIFMLPCLALLTTLFYLPNIVAYSSIWFIYFECIVFTCFSLVPIYLYNSNLGPKVKYLFYIFYPLHLVILWFVKIYF